MLHKSKALGLASTCHSGAAPDLFPSLAAIPGPSHDAPVPFSLGDAGLSGRGAFAERSITAGDVLWLEPAAIAVLDEGRGQAGRCVICMAACGAGAEQLACPQCGLPFCSPSCADSGASSHAGSGECAVLARSRARGYLGCTSDERCALRLLHAWCEALSFRQRTTRLSRSLAVTR